MKLRRIFAAIAACAVAATMAISASAADKPYWTATVDYDEAKGGGGANTCMLDDLDIDYSKVDKVVVSIDTDGFLTKGTIGGNTIAKFKENDEDASKSAWDQHSGFQFGDEKDTTAGKGSGDFVWDKIGGLMDESALQVQFWWVTSKTVNINSVKIYDAAGTALFEYTYTPPAAGNTDSNSSTSSTTGSSSTAPSGGTTNPTTGATAGLALAGLAIAGAAVVASKKSK